MDKEQDSLTLNMEKLDIGEVLAPSTPSSPSEDKESCSIFSLDGELIDMESLYLSALHVLSKMREELDKCRILNPWWSREDVDDWLRQIKTFYDLRNSPLLYDKQANIVLFNRLCFNYYDHLYACESVRDHGPPK